MMRKLETKIDVAEDTLNIHCQNLVIVTLI